jgi:RNA polymerase sigma factor (sigma-70 family)
MKIVRHPNINHVWEKFRTDKCEELRTILIEHYLPIVKRIADRIYVKRPDELEHLDLVETGIFSLRDAINAFNHGRGIKFETYCTPRIRRAMFDEIRCIEDMKRITEKIKEARIMKNYLCRKCKTVVQKSSQPTSFNCPGGGSHEWTDLGNVGDTNYQCKKCATPVEASGHPASFNCPDGGNHQWTDLGKIGDDHYQCEKCSTEIMAERQPASFNCPEGGSHRWTKL